jgi:hypothetical protein
MICSLSALIAFHKKTKDKSGVLAALVVFGITSLS